MSLLSSKQWAVASTTDFLDHWHNQLNLGAVEDSEDYGKVIGVPFYMAQQIQGLPTVPVRLRSTTKPVVITTTKLCETIRPPMMDFDLRTTQSTVGTYNNLHDPHLKHFFNMPSKRKVLEARGFITRQGDVICHSLSEYNRHKAMLYRCYSELLEQLRPRLRAHMDSIARNKREVAIQDAERRRLTLLANSRGSSSPDQPGTPSGGSRSQSASRAQLQQTSSHHQARSSNQQAVASDRKRIQNEQQQPTAKGGKISGKAAKAKRKGRGNVQGRSDKKHIWEKTRHDVKNFCHNHSCVEGLTDMFEISDIPQLIECLCTPSSAGRRRKRLMSLLHTPNKAITGETAPQLLGQEVDRHASCFRWD